MKKKADKDNIIDILKTNANLSHIHDIDSLLDRVLYETRKITKSDAGSIYLLKDNKLSFEYVQNDTLMNKDSTGNKYIYSKQRIDINNDSIAGYVAMNKTGVRIDDVYKINGNIPYSFNRSFDENGY